MMAIKYVDFKVKSIWMHELKFNGRPHMLSNYAVVSNHGHFHQVYYVLHSFEIHYPYTSELHQLTSRASLCFFQNIHLSKNKNRHSHTELKSLYGNAIYIVEVRRQMP